MAFYRITVPLRTRRLSRILKASAAAFLFAASPAFAGTTYTWTGGTSGHGATANWSDQYNWSNGTAPAVPASDLVNTLLVMTGSVQNTNTLDFALSASSLTFDSNAGAFTIGASGSGQLTLGAGGITNNSSATNQTFNAPLVLGANQSWSNTGASGLVVGGAVNTGTSTGFALSVAGAGSGATNISGIVSGLGSIAKSSTGDLILTGANTYSGGTSISSGTLRIGTSNLALGSSTVTFTGNSTLAVYTGSAALSITNPIVINPGVTATFDTTVANLTLGGAISGSGALQKTSAGTLTLSVANTYSGGTTLGGGTIAISNAAALGTGAVTFTASAAVTSSTGTVANAISIPGGVTATLNSGSSGKFNGVISGAGAVTSTGTTGLSGTNTFTGGLIIAAGQSIGITTDYALGTAPVSFVANDIQINNGSYLSTVVAGAGYAFTTSANRGIVLSGTGGFACNSANIIINGVISGSGSLTRSSSNSLTLNGANTYTGSTTLPGGTNFITSIKTLASGTASSLGIPSSGNGTIALGNNAATAGLTYLGSGDTTDRVINLVGTTGGATLDQSGAGLLVFTSNFTATGAGIKTLTLQGSTGGIGEIDGIIPNNSSSNTTALTKLGTGTWTLGGSNMYTGLTTVTAGTLNLNGSLLSAITVASGATLAGSGSTTANISFSAGSYAGAGAGVGTGVLGATVTVASGTNIYIPNPTIGTSPTTATVIRYAGGTGPGTANFANASSYRGGSLADTGSAIQLTYTASSRTWNTTNGIWDVGTSTSWLEGDTKFYWADAVTFNNPAAASTVTINGTVAPSTISINNSSSAYTLAAGTSAVISGNGTLTKSGTGTATISTSDTYTGGTTLSGGTLTLTSATALGSGTVTFSANAILNTSPLVVANLISVSAGAIATLNSGSGGKFSGIISGAGAVTSTTQTGLSGTNTFTGGIIVASGQDFGVTGDTALGALPTSFIANNITINGGYLSTNVDGGAFTLVVNVNRGIVLNGTGGFDCNTATVTVNSIISGTGNLTRTSNSANLFLYGANTFTGTTALPSGTTFINSIKTLASGAASSLGIPGAGNGTISIGSGSTSATLTYTGTGDTTDRAINLAGTTGGATLDQSGTGLLKYAAAAFTAGGAGAKTLTIQGSTAGTGEIDSAVVDNSSNNTTSLAKTGTGTWSLNGSNTYSGTTTVTAGTLALGASGALPTASAVSLGGGTLAALTGTTNTTSGTLAMTANSTLNLGGSTSQVTSLSFGNSSALTWTGTLSITGYTGPGYGTPSSTTELFFGNSSGGLTAAQLGAITFVGFPQQGAEQLSTGELVPVPEPATILGLAAIALLGGGCAFRRRNGAAQPAPLLLDV